MAGRALGVRVGADGLRERSEELVLRALQQYGIERSSGFGDASFQGVPLTTLADMAGLSRPSVYNVQKRFHGLFGTPLLLLPKGYVFGVDFGPRHARVTLSDLHAQRFEEDRFEIFDLRQPPELYLDWAAERIGELLGKADVQPAEVIGVGISQVAPINCHTGHPHPSGLTNKAWRDVNVGDQLARRLAWEHIETSSDNDTNLRLLAEHTVGTAQGLDDVVYVNWSNHVGFGLILAGQPYRGSQGYAGELGHRPIGADTEECPRCERMGCLEMVIGAVNLLPADSSSEVEANAAEHVFQIIDRERQIERADDDTTRTMHVRLMEAAERLGKSVASIVDTLDPEVILLGGSLGARVHDDTAVLAKFRAGLESAMMGFAKDIAIRQPKLHDRGAVEGATLRLLSEQLVPWARRTFQPEPDDA